MCTRLVQLFAALLLALSFATLPAQEAAQPSGPIITPEAAAEWADIGKNIGVALSEAAKAMSVGVNDFAGTFVGKLTIILIVWKVIGQDMWAIFGGTAFWIAITIFLSWSYRRHHFTFPVDIPETERQSAHTEYLTRVEMSDDERNISMIVHLVLFVAATITSLFIIF
jgi:hypothetical protein